MERGCPRCRPRSLVTAGTSLPQGGLTRPAGKRRPAEVPFLLQLLGSDDLEGRSSPRRPCRHQWDSQAATMVQNVILVFFRRRLSQRPAVEELERRNILKRE